MYKQTAEASYQENKATGNEKNDLVVATYIVLTSPSHNPMKTVTNDTHTWEILQCFTSWLSWDSFI